MLCPTLCLYIFLTKIFALKICSDDDARGSSEFAHFVSVFIRFHHQLTKNRLKGYGGGVMKIMVLMMMMIMVVMKMMMVVVKGVKLFVWQLSRGNAPLNLLIDRQ